MFKNKLISSIFLLLLFCCSSCDKENINKEFGQYAISVHYTTERYSEIRVFLDGVEVTSFVPIPLVIPTYVAECSDLNNAEKLTNVCVLENIEKGEHKVELKNKNGEVLKTLFFEMVDRECIFQQADFAIN